MNSQDRKLCSPEEFQWVVFDRHCPHSKRTSLHAICQIFVSRQIYLGSFQLARELPHFSYQDDAAVQQLSSNKHKYL